MAQVSEYLSSWLSAVRRITFTNIMEIIIIAIFVYMILVWFKNSRAWTLFRGLIVIFVFVAFCAAFRLDTILWILGKAATIAVIAVIVIFQPELRRGLESIGSRNLFKNLFGTRSRQNGFTEKTAAEIAKAAFEMGRVKTGALIVVEAEDSVREYERTGIEIDGRVSAQLLINIFEKNTPLHDGAVIIRGNTITAATCYLPLSDNMDINKALGTRHRAAIGVSEVTDSITVVVSEETGHVSVAEAGKIEVMKDAAALRTYLEKLETAREDSSPLFRFGKVKPESEEVSDREHRA